MVNTMRLILSTVFCVANLALIATAFSAEADDPVAPWKNATVRPVSTTPGRQEAQRAVIGLGGL